MTIDQYAINYEAININIKAKANYRLYLMKLYQKYVYRNPKIRTF